MDPEDAGTDDLADFLFEAEISVREALGYLNPQSAEEFRLFNSREDAIRSLENSLTAITQLRAAMFDESEIPS